jgi:hypothetical protein
MNDVSERSHSNDQKALIIHFGHLGDGESVQ